MVKIGLWVGFEPITCNKLRPFCSLLQKLFVNSLCLSLAFNEKQWYLGKSQLKNSQKYGIMNSINQNLVK